MKRCRCSLTTPWRKRPAVRASSGDLLITNPSRCSLRGIRAMHQRSIHLPPAARFLLLVVHRPVVVVGIGSGYPQLLVTLDFDATSDLGAIHQIRHLRLSFTSTEYEWRVGMASKRRNNCKKQLVICYGNFLHVSRAYLLLISTLHSLHRMCVNPYIWLLE